MKFAQVKMAAIQARLNDASTPLQSRFDDQLAIAPGGGKIIEV